MKLTKEQDALFDLYGGEVSPGEAMPDSMKAAVVSTLICGHGWT